MRESSLFLNHDQQGCISAAKSNGQVMSISFRCGAAFWHVCTHARQHGSSMELHLCQPAYQRTFLSAAKHLPAMYLFIESCAAFAPFSRVLARGWGKIWDWLWPPLRQSLMRGGHHRAQSLCCLVETEAPVPLVSLGRDMRKEKELIIRNIWNTLCIVGKSYAPVCIYICTTETTYMYNTQVPA